MSTALLILASWVSASVLLAIAFALGGALGRAAGYRQAIDDFGNAADGDGNEPVAAVAGSSGGGPPEASPTERSPSARRPA